MLMTLTSIFADVDVANDDGVVTGFCSFLIKLDSNIVA